MKKDIKGVETPQEIEKAVEREKIKIQEEKENVILNRGTLAMKLVGEHFDRSLDEAVSNDLFEIQTLMPHLLESTTYFDSGYVDLEQVRKNAMLGYDDIDTLPKQLKYQRLQNIDVYSRIRNSKYQEWKEDKKVLDDDDYLMLVNILNDDRQGITFKDLSTLVNMEAREILDIFKRMDGFITLDYLCRYGATEMVLYDDFYVRLIPIVNSENKLENLKYQYLLKPKAIETFMQGLKIYKK